MLNPDAATEERDTAPLMEEPSAPAEEYNAFAPTDDAALQAECEGLAFVNTDGGNEGGAEPEVAEAASGNPWGKVVASFKKMQELKQSMTGDMAPWTGFFNKNKMSVPQKSEVFKRVRYNLKIYHSNYMVVLFFLAAWTALSNLYFVLAMFSSVGSFYYYRAQTQDGSTFMFRGKEVSAMQFYALLTGVTLFLFYVTGGSSTIFWLVASALITVVGHAASREVSEEDMARIDQNGTVAQDVAAAASTASSWGLSMPTLSNIV